MMILALLQIVAAWLLADLVSGVYHVLTDRGWNIRWQVKMFAWHHEKPQEMRPDWYGAIAGIPIALLGLWWTDYAYGLITFGVLLSNTQLIHYLAHHPEKAGILRWLQLLGVILSPREHNKHHDGDHDKSYCVVSGINNYWITPLLNSLIPDRFKHATCSRVQGKTRQGQMSGVVPFGIKGSRTESFDRLGQLPVRPEGRR